MSKSVKADDLPYRSCVGIVVFNRENKVWAGQRLAVGNTEYDGQPQLWQFPQGGIDKGEEPYPAALRELYEETGMRSVELIEAAPRLLRYDLPEHLIGIGLRGKYRGQEQHWYALRFTGNDSEIAISPPPDGHKAEFDAWEWADLEDMPNRIVPFKKALYAELVDIFRYIAS